MITLPMFLQKRVSVQGLSFLNYVYERKDPKAPLKQQS